MLGISGAGKTSYMAGLAQRMCNVGVGGFTIAPTGSNAAAAAVERSRFTQLMFSSNDYYFPPGTISTSKWIFALSKNGKAGPLFEWVDFRGGFIDQLHRGVDETSRSQVEEFLRYAQASDALLIFVDSVRLYRYQDNPSALEAFIRVSPLFQYLIDISREDCSRPGRSIIIVNTKADSDLLPSDMQRDNFMPLNLLSHRLFRRHIDPLFAFGWHVGFCSVGAVGIGSVKSTENPPKSFREPPEISVSISNHPNPINVETPLLYCLLQEVRRISALGENRVAQLDYERSRLEKERTLWNYALSKIQGTPLAGDMVRDIEVKLRQEKNVLHSFRSLMPDLEALVRGKILVASV